MVVEDPKLQSANVGEVSSSVPGVDFATCVDKMSTAQTLHRDADSTQSIKPLNNAFLGLTNQALTPKLVKIGKVSSERVVRAGDVPKKSNRLHYTRKQLVEISKLDASREQHASLKENPKAPIRKPIVIEKEKSKLAVLFLHEDPRETVRNNLKEEPQTRFQKVIIPREIPGRQMNARFNHRDYDRNERSENFRGHDKFSSSNDNGRRMEDNGKDPQRPFLRSRGEDLSNNFAANRHNFRNGDRGNRYNNNHQEKREEEPEWYVNGPTSQHDVIELNGFESPEPSEKGSLQEHDYGRMPEKKNSVSQQMHSGMLEEKFLKEDEERAKEDFDINEIFKFEWQRTSAEQPMDQKTVDTSEPENFGSSKFVQWFNGQNPKMMPHKIPWHPMEQLAAEMAQRNQELELSGQANGEHFRNGPTFAEEERTPHAYPWQTQLPLEGQPQSAPMEQAASKNENHLLNILRKARINVNDLMHQRQPPPLHPGMMKAEVKSAAELEANILQQDHVAQQHQMPRQSNLPVNPSQLSKTNSETEFLQQLIRQSNRTRNGREGQSDEQSAHNPLKVLFHQNSLENGASQPSAQPMPANSHLAKLFAQVSQARSTESEPKSNGKVFANQINTFLPTSVIRKIASDKEKDQRFVLQENQAPNQSQSNGALRLNGEFEQTRQTPQPSDENVYLNGMSKTAYEYQKWEHELLGNQFAQNAYLAQQQQSKQPRSMTESPAEFERQARFEHMNSEDSMLCKIMQQTPQNVPTNGDLRPMPPMHPNAQIEFLQSGVQMPTQMGAMRFAKQPPPQMLPPQFQHLPVFGVPMMGAPGADFSVLMNSTDPANLPALMQMMALRQQQAPIQPPKNLGENDKQQELGGIIERSSSAMSRTGINQLNLRKIFEEEMASKEKSQFMPQMPIQKAVFLEDIERQ